MKIYINMLKNIFWYKRIHIGMHIIKTFVYRCIHICVHTLNSLSIYIHKYKRIYMYISTADSLTMTRQLWRDHAKSDI